MQSRRKFLFSLTAAVAATGFVVATVFADELIGVITKIDVDAKKITVVEKDTDKVVVVKITDETEQVRRGGEAGKVDLEKLEGFLKKQQDAGKKGLDAKVWHEKNVASKLQIKGGGRGGKKKAD
jgi:hypothetical protein